MQPTAKLYAFVCTTLVLCARAHDVKSIRVPNSMYAGPVKSEITASAIKNMDWRKVTPRANETSFDWWYFDAVSTTSQNESVAIVFYNAGPISLTLSAGSSFFVQISGTFANGTLFSRIAPAGDEVEFAKDSETILGDWKGSGAYFQGQHHIGPGDLTYTVTINSPQVGIHGKLKLLTRAQPHYPCSPVEAGATEEIVPGLGWANVMPDAWAHADLSIDNERIIFDGAGYHDKNWATQPESTIAQSWYWGHASFRNYSAVWYDVRARDAKEYVSGYVTYNGVMMEASCARDAVYARPYGENSEYPPTPTTGVPQAMNVVFHIGDDHTLVLNVTTLTVALESPDYQRYIGFVEGSFDDGATLEGKALYEAYKQSL